MAATPDGSVVDEVNSGEDDLVPPRGAGRDDRGGWRTSQPVMDSMVMETQVVVQVHAHVGDMPQTLQNSQTQ